MRHFRFCLHKLSLASAVLLLGSFLLLPLTSMTFADDIPCTAPASNQPGVHQLTGADASTFTYQCDGPNAGLWTNAYYVYSPATGIRTPLYSPDYAYDCNTGIWTMTEWDYSANSGKFFSSRVVAPTPPALPTNCPTASPTSNPSTGAPATGSATPATANASLVSTGPGSSNSTTSSATLNGTNTTNTNAAMNNGLTSTDTSGDASVASNTAGGSATSGDAQSIANIANILQSSTNAFGPNTAVFTANINGNVNGDFMFDPAAILASGPGSSNTAANNLQVNLAKANSTTAAINNKIDVGAATGDATVASNTTGGNATSGNASAVVNLMNLINSTVAAGQSFVGTININGDLNGDILLPPNVLNALLATTGPNSSNSAKNTVTASDTTTNNATLASTTNVTNSATSGNAIVTGNTTGGSATSGSASNNVTLLNLTGSNIIGKDDLLVFVNVLGKWVGMIMNAPQGTTAAELGGGITSSGPNSANDLTNSAVLTASETNNANLGITNNVNVHAKSGDAAVTNNTLGGNATSGNANTAVNVLNMLGSNLSLSNWFGVLFINVFGIWNGSFGINTSAGDPVIPPNVPTNNAVQAVTHQAMIDSLRSFAGFTPSGGTPSSTNTNSGDFQKTAVLGTSSSHFGRLASASKQQHTYTTKAHASYTLPLIGLGVALLILVAGERDRLFGTKK